MKNGFRTKKKLTKRNKAVIQSMNTVLVASRAEARLVCQSLLMAVAEYYGSGMPQELVEMVFADVQELTDGKREIAKDALQALIVQTVQDFKAVVAEINADMGAGE